MTTGIHHVTAITRRVQANVDFYTGFLGLRLVKRTGGFEDAEQLHLFYGDALGSPGSIISFLVWEDGAPGRTGLGQVAEIALAVPADRIGDWLTRAMAAGVPATGPAREFGETVLRLKDPDGIIVKLVGVDLPAAAPLPDPIAPTRLRGVTLLTDQPQETEAFITRFGYRFARAEGAVRRLESDTDSVDLRDATGYFPGIPGTGILDHVAFRAPDVDAVRRMRLALGSAATTSVHDRRYFLSLYARDPAGILTEYATDAPGFTIDEPAETLGHQLFMPPHDQHRIDDLRVMLPQFALPGEERTPMRDLPFIHRFHRPNDPDGQVMLLLHGTGGSETDLMPLAARIAPRATLLGLRGRSSEEGINRWFRRFDAMSYDQADIRAESAALAGFAAELPRAYGIDPAQAVWLGYSNGANLLGAAMRLHPGLARRAILLRGIEVLEQPPQADLSGTSALLLSGADDPFTRLAPPLERSLTGAGVALEARVLATGHQLSPDDLAAAQDWLAQNP
ncbi:MAG: VOC family protein [Paracoccus sp. (in: a-proteobacteria)]|uniref:VOC family protein n=1 Tax=Paracoccus sp. TaxID=267 RepID=UPI0026DF8A23|nr:VOC family protein [Paracoccus sp. (in: a-proteobacteria)]MDO5631025.1 VOC family protein [Paracoccus sp. (in: a-proteobacteria)]